MKSNLTDAAYDRLAEILDGFSSEHAMNLEMMDGFFAALVCSPDLVPPGEYLPEIWGGDAESSFADMQEAQEFMELAMAHWNTVTDKLHSGEAFLPLLLEEESSASPGNDWAIGFMRGMDMRHQDWIELVNDEEQGGALIAIFALAHENHPDPELRPYKEPMSAERREQLIVGCAAGVMAIYRYFEPQRRERAAFPPEPVSYRRTSPRIGRNEPCPCGSGNKYKRCCGAVALQ